MALAKGHQAIEETVYGTTRTVKGQITVVNVKRYAAEVVNPPDGIKTQDWIKASLKRAK
jgi:branched-chain amino acid transport system substrate-binding protein